jgi:hypothetical protein
MDIPNIPNLDERVKEADTFWQKYKKPIYYTAGLLVLILILKSCWPHSEATKEAEIIGEQVIKSETGVKVNLEGHHHK